MALAILCFVAIIFFVGFVLCVHAWLLRLGESDVPVPEVHVPVPHLHRRGRRAAVLSATVLAALAGGLAGCATNPVTGHKQLALISEQQEIELGRQNDQAVRQQIGIYDDRDLNAYVDRIGQELARRSERPNLEWHFAVVDDPAVNAFALPGGYVYVTRGLLAHVTSEAELAAVMGHEIGHVTARHSVSQISKQQLAGLALGIGMIVSPELRNYGNLAQTGLGLLFLKFSRADETQADDLGLRYMTADGYDPRQMPMVFDMLQRVSQAESGGGRVPEWLSSHPDPGNRRERSQQAIAEMKPDLSRARVERASYLKRIDGIVFGDDPRQGFFQGATFYQPEMRIRLDFPQGWKTANQRTQVAAISPNQDAIVVMSLSGERSAQAAAQQLLGQQGIQTGPVQRGDIGGYPALATRFSAATQQGQLDGQAVFIEADGKVYQIVGYGSQSGYARASREIERALGSFSRVTDRRILDVQPQRLDVVAAQQAGTLADVARRHNSTADLQELSLLNQLDARATVTSGQLVKLVTGTPPDRRAAF